MCKECWSPWRWIISLSKFDKPQTTIYKLSRKTNFKRSGRNNDKLFITSNLPNTRCSKANHWKRASIENPIRRTTLFSDEFVPGAYRKARVSRPPLLPILIRKGSLIPRTRRGIQLPITLRGGPVTQNAERGARGVVAVSIARHAGVAASVGVSCLINLQDDGTVLQLDLLNVLPVNLQWLAILQPGTGNKLFTVSLAGKITGLFSREMLLSKEIIGWSDTMLSQWVKNEMDHRTPEAKSQTGYIPDENRILESFIIPNNIDHSTILLTLITLPFLLIVYIYMYRNNCITQNKGYIKC